MNIRTAVFIGAHTDDEIVCAGALKRLAKEGASIWNITFSNSTTENYRDEFNDLARSILLKEYGRSMDILGIPQERCTLLNFGCDTMWRKRDEIRQIIFDFVDFHKPDLAFILSPNDDHQAHQIVGEEAERVMKGRVSVILRCQYPWNYRRFNPNVYVSLTPDEFQTKISVMKSYPSQGFRYKYEQIFEHYTIADGLSVKTQAAEKFELVRIVI